MYQGYKKYISFQPEKMTDRKWPSNLVTQAPVWCSVDLRDGNQALVDPMNLEEKLSLFQTLVDIGIKEIEVGFPSSSETEYEILRTLIEGGYIPDDVTIQVLVQARPHLIQKTFEAIAGAKNVIVHFYNSTSVLQRKVVFQTDMDGIINIAVEATRLIRTLTDDMKDSGTNIRFEYSPESFSGTEMDNAVAVCQRVIEEIGATPDHKIILNLPSTVEGSMPNQYADQLEYFCNNLPSRDCAIISVHPHNDRGTAVAAAELALLAGAERIEGTLFGNGERTGNVDLVTLAMNMYSQGINSKLDFRDINHVKEVYEKTTKMRVHQRHPYVGELVFTAFSGSHQDAISKGMSYMLSSGTSYWEVPYLPIDPADVGRQYEPVIRINNQSGKGGAAFVIQANYGFELPKAMHPEFGAVVKTACDKAGTELQSDEIFELFQKEYIDVKAPYGLIKHSFQEDADVNGESHVRFSGTLCYKGDEFEICGEGNGPIDSFFNAVSGMKISGFQFLSYNEHAISSGSDSLAVAYVQLLSPVGESVFGVGISHNINLASIRAIICAINRAVR